MDESAALQAFADEVGPTGPVTIAGASTRGGAVDGVRCVAAPAGIRWVQADEMTVRCGAGLAVADLQAELASVGQCVALPPSGTVGGALSVGISGVERLGRGPVRDVLLEARFVGADGTLVTAGGPTVKNVSGFDVCRLLVGARGTLGFLGEVILRTRPLPQRSQWFQKPCHDPLAVLAALYRPTAVLWDGAQVWVLLEGHPDDVGDQAAASNLRAVDGPPILPPVRNVVAPAEIGGLRATPWALDGFVAEVGVGVVHAHRAAPQRTSVASARAVSQRMKAAFDPTGRLNPGVMVGG